MDLLKTKVSNTNITYDGTQLSPHWIYRTFDLLGDSLVSFIGPAHVSIDHMVDLEDVIKNAPIYSPRMLHFLGEWFMDSLDEAILLQHLLTATLYGRLWEREITHLHRRGNDIYYKERKLTVSIATKSLTSCLIHTGINIETHGTPVPTSGLAEMGIDPIKFGNEILEIFHSDYQGWKRARAKVIARN